MFLTSTIVIENDLFVQNIQSYYIVYGGLNIADNTNKVPESSFGPYYVDEECIGCELCVDTAPKNFKMTDDGTHAYVHKQPENDSEKEMCDEALASCPVDAIGNDG
ncbi:ferredoxin [Methanolobus sp. ZRKC2]|uniref:ferredoxin n=1 Tax=Methanolobus sp. ZRKC2 TaxID=3125783 RepID=UPI003872F1BD